MITELLSQEKDPDSIKKLKKMIQTYDKLIDVYMYNKGEIDKSQIEITSSQPELELAVEGAITYFNARGYLLSAELLSHAYETTRYITYEPYFADIARDTTEFKNLSNASFKIKAIINDYATSP